MSSTIDDIIIAYNPRPVYNKKKFDIEFRTNERDELKRVKLRHRIKRSLKSFNPLNILNLFNVINLIVEYDFKKYLINDIISGLTVGVLHIPTGLAYGALTTLNPIYGLYSTFFPGLIYMLFCTSKHLSVGTFAIVSIMVYSTISKLEVKYLDLELIKLNTSTSFNQTDLNLDELSQEIKLKIATSLAFWCGIVQLTLSILRFGTITKYLSQPLLRGFTTGAAFHVLTAQMQNIFGVYSSKPNRSSYFKIFRTYLRIIRNYHSINLISVCISIIAIIFLVIIKLYVNDKLKKKLRNIPIPSELMVIIAGILVSYFGNLNKKFNLAIVGTIPVGLPTPRVPDFSLFIDVIPDAIIIALVGFATSISIADLYARKHHYKIDSNREIFALGMCNLVGSFFRCFTASGTLARSVVQEESGGKTQFVTVIASIVVLMVMYFVSPILQLLPKACLGAIIVSALINVLKQVKDICYYWKLDKIDFISWFITFSTAVIFDIDYGLWMGIIAVLFLNTYRNQKLNLIELGQVKNYEIFSDANKYISHEQENVKIIRLSSSLFYVNCDYFRNELNKLCPLKNVEEEKTLIENCISNYGCLCCYKCSNTEKPSEKYSETNLVLKHYEAIILDFSQVQFVDETGVKCLKMILKEYKDEQVKIFITNLNDDIQDFLKRLNVYENNFDQIIYLTVQDALFELRRNHNKL